MKWLQRNGPTILANVALILFQVQEIKVSFIFYINKPIPYRVFSSARGDSEPRLDCSIEPAVGRVC